MPPLESIAWGALSASALMTLIWLVQRQTGDASLVDVAWAGSVGALALVYCWHGEGLLERRLLASLLGSLWSFRLALYLFFDRIRAGAEDGRYQMLRQNWGDRAPTYFFLLFQVQALLVVTFALPFLLVAQNPSPLSIWDGLGAAIFAVALIGESLADRQLARFRRDPQNCGRTCASGLWRYSRHPNYFFEWLHWWTYVPMAIHSIWGLASLAGPMAMLYLLFFVTGIPYTEKQALKSRGEGYRAYQRRTSAFVPWFPRKERP